MRASVLQISAGTGPAETRRFVAMLGEHLVSWCAFEGHQVSEVVIRGPEAEPSSVEIHVLGDPLSLAVQKGTHVLVARSPTRAKKSRKRWYVGVSLLEANSDAASIQEVRPEEVTITAMRAGGPGGQHVNKTSTAIRATHNTTGVTVRASGERSQRENLRIALRRLGAVLAARAEDEQAQRQASRRLQHFRLERGRPAFAYELDRKGDLVSCEATCLR